MKQLEFAAAAALLLGLGMAVISPGLAQSTTMRRPSSERGVAVTPAGTPAAATEARAQDTRGDGDTRKDDGNAPVTYLRTTGSAVVRNFPDANGAELSTLTPGTIVRGLRRSGGNPVFVEVEVGGGFPVWVYGEYLQPTDVEGVLLVTGSRVNMRPLPELTTSSMPLRSKLALGERVRLIQRANRAAAFGQDWIRIQAPPSARAWIAESSLQATDARKGEEAWAAANTALPDARPRAIMDASIGASTGAGAGIAGPTPRGAAETSPVPPELLARLSDANRAFEAADALVAPTTEAWRDVVAMYEEVLEEAPASSLTHSTASRRLRDAEMKLQLEEAREEIVAVRQQNEEEVRQLDVYLDRLQRQKSARWGRFEERGWVESRNVNGQRRWFVTFGGETVAELRCQSKRYDLDVFEGFEIGIVGREVAPVVRATTNTLAEARIVDASRIEVISASSIRR